MEGSGGSQSLRILNPSTDPSELSAEIVDDNKSAQNANRNLCYSTFSFKMMSQVVTQSVSQKIISVQIVSQIMSQIVSLIWLFGVELGGYPFSIYAFLLLFKMAQHTTTWWSREQNTFIPGLIMTVPPPCNPSPSTIFPPYFSLACRIDLYKGV